jgi:hypothetical protein
MASDNRVAWGYVDDDAETMRVSAKGVYVLGADAAKYGGAAAAGSVKAKPAGMRMRGVLCVDATGYTIVAICYTTAATLWTTPGTTVTRNRLGLDVVFTATSQHVSEKRGRQCKQAS